MGNLAIAGPPGKPLPRPVYGIMGNSTTKLWVIWLNQVHL